MIRLVDCGRSWCLWDQNGYERTTLGCPARCGREDRSGRGKAENGSLVPWNEVIALVPVLLERLLPFVEDIFCGCQVSAKQEQLRATPAGTD